MNLLRIAVRVAERQKGLFREIRKKYPHVPDYVMREVYNGTDRDKSASKSLEGLVDEVGSRDWKQEKIPLQWDKLSSLTRKNFARRKLGLENPDQVPNDAERLARQFKSMGDDNEPVIMFFVNGKYELLEGFHRTMARLVSGSPDLEEDLKKIAETDSENDFKEITKNWKSVPTKAWVGYGKPDSVKKEDDWSDFDL